MGILLLVLSVVGGFALLFYVGFYLFGFFATPFLTLHNYFTAKNKEEKAESKTLLLAIAFFVVMISVFTFLSSK